MDSMKSYVISVSVGTGCYRHILISGDATLFDLHSAILDAFEFTDDHAHAFFMDNRAWNNASGYYADMIKDEHRHTCDYRLSDMALQIGKQFKYIFDFGEEWVFQCKVLRVSDESCNKPAVVRSKGEAPNQYWSDDESDCGQESDEVSLPEIYPPAKLKKLFAGLVLPKETISLLYTYFDAMARLYGVIPLRKALEIINSQNDGSVSEKAFADFAEIVRHEDHFYCLLGADELYTGDVPLSPLDMELVEESLYMVDADEYEKLVAAQKDKPYYVPPKEELLRFADDDYYEQTPQNKALRDYLRHQKGMAKVNAEELVEELQLMASIDKSNIQYAIDDMDRMGVRFENQKEVEDFMHLYTDMSNHTRMAVNRGYTPHELFMKTPPDRRVPKSISFGPNIMAALKRGEMDIDELRYQILQMDFPNDDLRRSMLDNLDRIQNSSISSTVEKKKKTGRNDPCPCGSGKKYKYCCGRDQ